MTQTAGAFARGGGGAVLLTSTPTRRSPPTRPWSTASPPSRPRSTAPRTAAKKRTRRDRPSRSRRTPTCGSRASSCACPTARTIVRAERLSLKARGPRPAARPVGHRQVDAVPGRSRASGPSARGAVKRPRGADIMLLPQRPTSPAARSAGRGVAYPPRRRTSYEDAAIIAALEKVRPCPTSPRSSAEDRIWAQTLSLGEQQRPWGRPLRCSPSPTGCCSHEFDRRHGRAHRGGDLPRDARRSCRARRWSPSAPLDAQRLPPSAAVDMTMGKTGSTSRRTWGRRRRTAE